MISWKIEAGRRIDQGYFSRVAEILVDLHRYQQATRNPRLKPLRFLRTGQQVKFHVRTKTGKQTTFIGIYGDKGRKVEGDLSFLLGVLENVCNKPYFTVSEKQSEWIKHIVVANLDRLEPLYQEVNDYRKALGQKLITIPFENLPRKASKRTIEPIWDKCE